MGIFIACRSTHNITPVLCARIEVQTSAFINWYFTHKITFCFCWKPYNQVDIRYSTEPYQKNMGFSHSYFDFNIINFRKFINNKTRMCKMRSMCHVWTFLYFNECTYVLKTKMHTKLIFIRGLCVSWYLSEYCILHIVST